VANQGNRTGALTPESLSTKLNRINQTARENPTFQFRTLAHLITPEMLEVSFGVLRRDAAAGVDGITVGDYEKNLRENLKALHTRLKEGRYRAQPLRRTYIEKEDGKQRPLSIPVLEDKIAQRATIEILNRIYENDFLPCSYGYRPKRGAHDAVDALRRKIVGGKVSYILDADIKDYFGTIVRGELVKMLQKRVLDRSILGLIGKWLHVGVIEDGQLLMSEDGTYQGSVISPLLANVYLHEVLDLWVEEVVKPRLKGEVTLFRFADDFVATFQYKADAERFLRVLPKRFAKFGLNIHPQKTRLVAFGRFAEDEARGRGCKPETFSFLGFTFICDKTREEGKFLVKLKTASKKLRRGLKRVGQWCKENRHKPVFHQWQYLCAALRGHYNYYGWRSNARGLEKFHHGVFLLWWKWLSRRNRDGLMPLERYQHILKRHPLPKPRLRAAGKGRQLLLFGEWA
jgi:group II intron reverse transcriptase/maturase